MLVFSDVQSLCISARLWLQVLPQLSYPFICWWTSRLLPRPGYYKQCCDEHWGTCVSAITICSDFGAPKNKFWHCFHCFPICFPWSDGTRCHDLSFFECWVLSQLFYSPLSPLPRGSLVTLHFLPLEGYHLHIWSIWYFSQQSWFQLVLHPGWHFTWYTLHIS